MANHCRFCASVAARVIRMGMTRISTVLICGASLAMSSGTLAAAPVWQFRDDMLKAMVAQVPKILDSQDKATGRFGTGIWIVLDQNVMWPLAVAWATQHPANPYYHSPEVLDSIMAAGDALIAEQLPDGQWEFRKKDASTWGPFYMPWTYSCWVRAFALIQEAMPPDRRAKWETALSLGYGNIATKELETVHNIPVHHAMGLYCAGKSMDRPEWCTQAAAFMKKAVATQDPGGFWSENSGPVVGYNLVYMDAVGCYYAMSNDAAVLDALRRGAIFHANFTYPDGTDVETVDERQVYHGTPRMPNVGFTFTEEGRGYMRAQWPKIKIEENSAESAEVLASIVYYGEEGAWVPTPGAKPEHRFVLGDNAALVRREGPWFVAMSAYHTAVPERRWIQDRQNFVSVFHDSAGLIVGGGNTKLQPLWSNFCAGDTALLKHTPGNESPNFAPPPGITHVPDEAELDPEAMSQAMRYGPARCAVKVELANSTTARLIYTAECDAWTTPVVGHVTLLPREGKAWSTASGKSGVIQESAFSEKGTINAGVPPKAGGAFRFTAEAAGGAFEHAGWRVKLPPGSTIQWPAEGHNPYKKAGESSVDYARIVVVLPFSKDRQTIAVDLAPTGK
jgi:hypothetical protein